MPFVAQFLHSGTLFTTEPGKVSIGWGKRVWSTSASPAGLPAFYFPDFFHESKTPWCQHESGNEISIDELIALLETTSVSSTISIEPICWQTSSKSAFKSSYHELKKLLLAGTLEKGVPYVFERADARMTPERLKSSLLALLHTLKQQPLYGYGFWDAHQGLLGATPELLFRSDCASHRKIETMACAGTQRSGGHEALFLQNPKEQHEHELVIQGVQESIATLGGKVHIHETKLLRLPLLTHLVTPLTAEFPLDLHFEEIVKALHPTPALGALPRQAGMQWLKKEQSRLPRHRYGAPAGILHAQGKGSTCAVAIRNVQWRGNWMSIGAGCGVVFGSQFEREWDELYLKIASIKKILNL